jgi:hypothetical protein
MAPCYPRAAPGAVRRTSGPVGRATGTLYLVLDGRWKPDIERRLRPVGASAAQTGSRPTT